MNATGTRMFINDVGELKWEEIDLLTAGADYGWNVREGFCVERLDINCGAPPAGMTNPIHAYHHDTGCATITGGTFIPKGMWPAAYDDDYIYADFSCGKMFRLSPNGSGGYDRDRVRQRLPRVRRHHRDLQRVPAPRTGCTTPTGATPSSSAASSTTARIAPVTRGRKTAATRAGPARAGLQRVHVVQPHARPATRLCFVQPAGADVAEPDDRHAGLERRGRQLERVCARSRRCPAIRARGPTRPTSRSTCR